MADKQAVLLIHGIGEQRPMDTLRGFVRAVWSTDTSVHHQFSPSTVWSKPDTISGSYELRRLTTGQNRAGIRTDFFEFYWAYLMSGTKISHVTAWARVLLLRWPWTVPKRLLGVWLLLVGAIAGIGGLVIYNASLPETEKLVRLPGWLATLAGLGLSALFSFAVIQVIGDAARYLNPTPPNIEERQEIRAKGIAILKKLHEGGYRRIIVVGHSLGSVIGYDVLTYAWAEFNTGNNASAHPREKRLRELEALIQEPKTPTNAYRMAQRAYLAELEANGNAWRVTDFVTLGSPLTHAAILLTNDEKELARKQGDREFPRCPPVTENGRISYPLRYELAEQDENTGKRRRTQELHVPHHAAVFGPTRWTNLYFPARLVIWGDVIGGPLAPIFGNGLRDLAVRIGKRPGLLSHTRYWSMPKSHEVSVAVEKLREALDLVDQAGAQDADAPDAPSADVL